MRFIALDFETSGIDPKRHAPVTLGVAIMDGDQVEEQGEYLLAPPMKDGRVTREYDVVALEISGVTWSRIKKEGSTAISVMSNLTKFVTDNCAIDLTVVAFNAPFDFSFYSELVFMAGGWNQRDRRFEQFISPLVGPWQCARYLAMHNLGESAIPRWSLDAVASHFGLSRSGDKHGALEDAILAGQIYARLTAASGNSLDKRVGKQTGAAFTHGETQ